MQTGLAITLGTKSKRMRAHHACEPNSPQTDDALKAHSEGLVSIAHQLAKLKSHARQA